MSSKQGPRKAGMRTSASVGKSRHSGGRRSDCGSEATAE